MLLSIQYFCCSARNHQALGIFRISMTIILFLKQITLMIYTTFENYNRLGERLLYTR